MKTPTDVTATQPAATPSPSSSQQADTSDAPTVEIVAPIAEKPIVKPDAATARPAHVAAIIDDPKARWIQLMAPAKQYWSKLTDAELQKTEGNEHRLATLVQGRYDIPRGDAYRQVKAFHEKQKS